jgi:hypothetical protein
VSDAGEVTHGLQLSWLYLTGLILAFGLIAVALETWIVRSQGRGWDVGSTRIVGVTLLITAALCFPTVLSDETAKEMGPAVAGLLGTVAGYLLGRQDDAQRSA